MKKISFVAAISLLAFSACKESFKKGDNGLEYKIVSKGSGEVIPYGQYMQIHVAQFYNNGKTDSLLSDSRTGPQGSMIEVLDSVNTPPQYYKILKQLKKGDSLVIRQLTDSAFRDNMASMPPFFKKGRYLVTTVKLEDIFATKELADAARVKSQEAAQVRQKAAAADQIKKDDKILTDYFAKNNIQASKGVLGTYVQILQPGTGAAIDTGVVVKTNYTGKTLDGKTFDSNTDPAFNHVQPLLVNMTNDPSLGTTVIPGWTDGFKLLNKGAKAKFYIPSSLAYGAQGAGADIKPNSILVFDVEVLDVLNKDQAASAAGEERRKMEEMQKRYMDSMQRAQPQQAPQQTPPSN
jgi:FKBP-type peptidyl-prolyl cis-trans isomerase